MTLQPEDSKRVADEAILMLREIRYAAETIRRQFSDGPTDNSIALYARSAFRKIGEAAERFAKK